MLYRPNIQILNLNSYNTIIYRKNKPIRDEYSALSGSSSKQKKQSENYYFNHKKELQDFAVSVQILRGYEFQDGKLPDTQKLQNSVAQTQAAIAEENAKIKAFSNSIGELSAIKEALEKYLSPQRETPNHERDGRTRGEQERA